MKSSNASAAAFGWDFQSNAAIMLMLTNTKTASSAKVEGETEDIEIRLDNGNVIFSQAKSVFDPYNDFSNVLAKLKAGLKTLNVAADTPNVEQLIYITNSPNPFNQPLTAGAFSGGFTTLSYNDLPETCKVQIETICKAENYTLDRGLLSICVLHFHGQNESRYRIVFG